MRERLERKRLACMSAQREVKRAAGTIALQYGYGAVTEGQVVRTHTFPKSKRGRASAGA